jgi:hypothetical protein
MTRRPARRAAVALVLLLLAGCDSSTAGHGTSAEPAPGAAGSGAATTSGVPPTATAATATATPTATAAAPTSAAPTATAADGANVAACADARCEVAVRAGTAIPVPATTTVRDVRVRAVTADRVTVTGHAIGDASSGSCTGQCDSTTTNGTFTIILGADGRAVENGLSITVGHIAAGTAVLKLEPAG